MSTAAQKQSIDGRAAVTPSAHYMGIDREIFAVGANILDSDCVFTGQVVTSPSLFTFRRLGAPADHAERPVFPSDVTLNCLQNALSVKSESMSALPPKADILRASINVR